MDIRMNDKGMCIIDDSDNSNVWKARTQLVWHVGAVVGKTLSKRVSSCPCWPNVVCHTGKLILHSFR